MHALLADALALAHAGFVLFVVGGLVLILIGAARRWAWVRNPGFRAVHLLLMMVVAAEAIFGMTCPLTTWERDLRRTAGQQTDESLSFMGRLAHRVLFIDVPEWIFPILHVGFAALVVLAFVLVPPRLRRGDRSR